MGLLLSLAQLSWLAAGSTTPCTANGSSYELSFTPTGNQLVHGKAVRPLTEENLGLNFLKDGPTHYAALTRKGPDFTTLVRTRFVQSGGAPKLSLDLIVDNRLVSGLKCGKSSGLSVVPGTAPAAERTAELITRFGGRITDDGSLDPVSLSATEASLLQFLNSSDSSEKESLDAYLDKAGPLILASPPSTFETLRNRFTKKEKDFLDVILTILRYKFHSDAQRYAGWIETGLHRKPRDWPQIRAGFRGFFKSEGFGAAGMESFFQDEMKKALPQVSAYELANITQKFSQKEEALVVKIWGAEKEPEYRPLKKTFAPLSAMENNLTRTLVAEEQGRRRKFDEFVLALSQLMQMPESESKPVRDHVKQQILPLVDRLNPLEKKSLTTALGEGGNKALSSLRQGPPRP